MINAQTSKEVLVASLNLGTAESSSTRLKLGLCPTGVAARLLATSDDDWQNVWNLPPDTLKRSRITVEALTKSSVYVHSNDHLVSFEPFSFIEGNKIQVPDVIGLTLDVKNVESDKTGPASVAVKVDGTTRLQVVVMMSAFSGLRS